MVGVQRSQEIELSAAGVGENVGRRLEVQNGRTGRAEGCSLVNGRQESGCPVLRAVGGQSARIREDDVGRQFVAHRAQAVDNPGADGRLAGEERAAVDQSQCRFVVDGGGRHRANEGEFIGNRTRMGQQLGEFHAAFPVRAKTERRAEQVFCRVIEVDLELSRVGLPAKTRKLGLGVEQVHLARSAVLEETDDRLGAGRVMGRRLGQRISATRIAPGAKFPLKQVGQCEGTDPAGVIGQEGSPIDAERMGVELHADSGSKVTRHIKMRCWPAASDRNRSKPARGDSFHFRKCGLALGQIAATNVVRPESVRG